VGGVNVDEELDAVWLVAKHFGLPVKNLEDVDISLPAVYASRPIRRSRRSKQEMDLIRGAMFELLRREHPMTNRQVFYRLVSAGVIAKTEAEYKGTVTRLLSEMRLAGHIPFGWISDNTRWMRKPPTYTGVGAFLEQAARTYRRSLWDQSPDYVEIWIEKDALAGVVYDITAPFDVPLMVTRGYASLSFLHEAAEAIGNRGQPAHIYFFGDYDPSGVDIARTTEMRLRQFAPITPIMFERVAVTEEQITGWDLPTRPTKKTDRRAKNFSTESVELDAIPPDQLRTLVDTCIRRHIDERQLNWLQVIEREERDLLLRMSGEAA
jgi:hypothetical protein